MFFRKLAVYVLLGQTGFVEICSLEMDYAFLNLNVTNVIPEVVYFSIS